MSPWRDKLDDPDWLRTCTCGHAEQIHDGRCTAGPWSRRCICESFTEMRRQYVGVTPT